jgi:hypothetical protein
VSRGGRRTTFDQPHVSSDVAVSSKHSRLVLARVARLDLLGIPEQVSVIESRISIVQLAKKSIGRTVIGIILSAAASSEPKERGYHPCHRNRPEFLLLHYNLAPYMHAKMSRLLRRLLLQIRLNTPLPRLSIIMLPLRFSLLRIIPSQTRDRTTNRTSNTV